MAFKRLLTGSSDWCRKYIQMPAPIIATVLILICSWLIVLDFAIGQAQPASDPVELTVTSLSEAGTVSVILRCELPSCDAVALRLTFDPQTLQVLQLDRGDILSGTGNLVHVLREDVDNITGTIDLAYITQDLGAIPFSGTGTLFILTVEQLVDRDPVFNLDSMHVASMSGETVFRYVPAPLTTATWTPTATPPTQTVTFHFQTEVAAPNNITISPIDHAKFTIVHIGHNNDGFVITVDFASPEPAAVMIDVPEHLACMVDLNEAASEQVFTLKAGDVNHDGVIDIQDTTAIGFGLGSSADVNADGQSNILDLIHIGRNYGAHVGECEQ